MLSASSDTVVHLGIEDTADINASGRVAGNRLSIPGDPAHSVLLPVTWDAGVVADLGATGIAHAINDTGQVVGAAFAQCSECFDQPVLYDGGTTTVLPIPTPDNHGGTATDINNDGQIAGTFNTVFDNPEAVSWIDGVPTDLGPGLAFGINEAGQIVGEQDVAPNTQQATLWDHGTVVRLGDGSAHAINNGGVIVGSRQLAGGFVPMMWDHGTATELPLPPGFDFGQAFGINDAGQIVGTGTPSSGNATRALLWTLPSVPVTTQIMLDVRPGDRRHRVNLHSHGHLDVALLSSASFDATTVDVGSICFGDAGDPDQRDCSAQRARRRDVNHDGRTDVVVRFGIAATGIDAGDVEACATGVTSDGRLFAGCGPITTTPRRHRIGS